MAKEIPEELGNRYRIDRPIAEGGMARVYEGTDTLLGRKVALKVLSAKLAVDPAFIARFEREAQAVASLNHPNLVGVFDIGADGEFHYIVMEYVEGLTLDAVIKRDAPMPPDRVTAITLAVCEGLGVAHNQGIIHRDIKPANIMIEPSGRVKVMDFGIAKTKTEGLTQAGAVLGTVKYLAPEQAHGAPVDGRTDIYALGCVMYEMLTGRPPISGESLMEIATRLMTEEPPPPSHLVPGIPAQMDRVVMRALAKDPEDRYANTAALQGDLDGSAPAVAAAGAVAGAGAAGSDPTLVQSRGDRTRVMSGEPAGDPPRRLGFLILGVLLLAGGAIALLSNFIGSDTPPAPSPAPLEEPTPTPTFSP
ncbi:MAG TPA: protein kinase, partial [Actinomycetota bacterium]|nr:protein kinase [Actinomycetota bacterium]